MHLSIKNIQRLKSFLVLLLCSSLVFQTIPAQVIQVSAQENPAPIQTPTPAPTDEPTATPTPTTKPTPIPTDIPTQTPTPTSILPTPTPTTTPIITVTPTPTVTPTSTPSPTPSLIPTPVATDSSIQETEIISPSQLTKKKNKSSKKGNMRMYFDKTDFKSGEKPSFYISFLSPSPTPANNFLQALETLFAKQVFAQSDQNATISARILDVNNNTVALPITITNLDQSNFQVDVNKGNGFRPGKYSLIVDNGTDSITQDFTWGVLAVNLNQSSYKVDETAQIGMAVLNDFGNTLCDASLTLNITNPENQIETFSTSDKSITVSEQCRDKSVTNIPDYSVSYIPKIEGSYQIELQAETANGLRILNESFQVLNNPEFVIKRHDTSMRIYPLATYTVNIEVLVNKDLTGGIKEIVPASFGIKNISAGGQIIDKNETIQTIAWPANLKVGESIKLFYEYDAPDISPQFYLLGPIEVWQQDLENPIFTEPRPWQIAADTVTTNSPTATTGGWTNPTYAYADDTSRASIASAKPSTTQTYYNYGYALASNAVVTQVRVRADAYGGNERLDIDVSWDGGTSWSSVQSSTLTTSEQTFWLDFTSATTWTPSTLTDANLRVRVLAYTVGGAKTVYLDWIPVEVTWNYPNISGTSDETSGTVAVAVNATLQTGKTGTISGGAWTISDVNVSSGDTVTVWIDAALEADESTGVGKYDGTGDMTGMVLNRHVLSIGSVDNQSLTVTNLSQYANTQDEDVMHGVSTSTLNVDAGSSYTDEEISILSGNTLTIGATETLTTYSLAISGTLTSGGASTYNVSGNWTNNGTFTASTSTVTFSGADSSTQTLSGNTTFYNFTASTTSNTAGRTIKFTDGSTTTVSGTWTITGYAGKVITLTRTVTTSAWTINPTAASVTYVNVSWSTNTGVSFCATYSTNGDNNTGWSIAAGASCNTAPNSPTSLAQKKVTGGVTLATGDWTNETQVQFTASASDTDNPDTLYLCVEKDILGTAFSDTEDSCGTGVAYSGTAVAITATITGITDANEYHWQARVKDAASAYSSWAPYDVNAESARDFGVDTTAPTSGTVYDGTEAGVDKQFNDGSLSSLSANWSGFNANTSGLLRYDYAIGTTAGGIDVVGWTSNLTSTSVTVDSLTLQTSKIYYFSVRAVDNAGNIQSGVNSDGQAIAPTLTFGYDPTSISFVNLNAGNSFTDTKNTTLTTSTNAYNGYVVRFFTTDDLKSTIYPASSIGGFTGGDYTTPAAYAGGDTGLGITSSDDNVQGVNKFAPSGGVGTLYFRPSASHTGPGEIIADHTANVSGSPISGENFTITYKVIASNIQAASPYSTTAVYTVTPQY